MSESRRIRFFFLFLVTSLFSKILFVGCISESTVEITIAGILINNLINKAHGQHVNRPLRLPAAIASAFRDVADSNNQSRNIIQRRRFDLVNNAHISEHAARKDLLYIF